MPFYTGATRDQRPPDRSRLSVLVFGTATDGALGESRWFEDIEQAAFAYGGTTVTRFNPQPTDGFVTLSANFLPDDPTLTLDSRFLFYHVNPVTGQAVRYTGLGNQTASGRPVTLKFDPIGYDPSIQVYDGGLWLQTAGYASHGLEGDILLPLLSALGELGSSNGTLLSIGGCRVGSSWLPSTPPFLEVMLPAGPSPLFYDPTGDAFGDNPTQIPRLPQEILDPKTAYAALTLSCLNQGDGTDKDLYLTITVTTLTTGIVIDPGLLGLPYVRRTYLFTDYPTWNMLWDAMQEDFTAGIQPLRITQRIPRRDPRSNVAPYAGITNVGVPSTYAVTYPDAGLGQPDMTTAAGWLVALAENDLPLDECPFVIFSGLTGQALAEDPESTIALLSILDRNAEGSDENPDIILILPWSLTPPPAGVPYSSATDADAMFNLADAIGPQLASRLLIVWGGIAQTIMPLALDSTPLSIPAAYAATGAFVRESSDSSPTSNIMHPEIKTAVANNVPVLVIQSTAETPSPALPTSVLSPKDLETLRVSGLSALTRSVGDRWCLHSPILLASRDPFRQVLCESSIRERIQRSLDRYLGETNTQAVRTRLSATLADLVYAVETRDDCITRQISEFSLKLVSIPSQETQIITSLLVEGRMALYGETSSISFQVGLRS